MSGIFGFKSNKEKAPIADLGFPVGSIFLTVNSANPSTYLGGTWVQIKDTFLLACGDTYSAGATGGEASVTLTSAQSGLRGHDHAFKQPKVTLGSHSHGTSADGEYYVTSTNPSAWNTHTDYAASGTMKIDASTDDQYAYHHRSKTESVNLGEKTATGGAVMGTAELDAAQAHNNMPPYLAVYVWQRTA